MGTAMLTPEEVKARKDALGGDALHVRGPRWEVVLRPPALKDWEFYLANRESPATKPTAGYILIRSMVAYAGPSDEVYEPGTIPGPQADFDKLRKRWVGIVEAISKSPGFDPFIGLEVVAEEKG